MICSELPLLLTCTLPNYYRSYLLQEHLQHRLSADQLEPAVREQRQVVQVSPAHSLKIRPTPRSDNLASAFHVS